MSRIGKKPIELPANTTVTINGNEMTVKGPKGQLSKEVSDQVTIKVEDSQVVVEPVNETRLAKSLWGTFASHVNNMVTGVNEGFSKKLIIEGVGYRAEVQGNNLVMQLGYSHPIEMSIPEGLTVTVEKNDLTVSGIDKEVVGQFAANIRSHRTPEPYKGKGIRYADEHIIRKEGKKAA